MLLRRAGRCPIGERLTGRVTMPGVVMPRALWCSRHCGRACRVLWNPEEDLLAMRAPTHWSRRVIAAIGLFAVLVVPLLAATPVQAFKPYTHVHAADRALADVV